MEGRESVFSEILESTAGDGRKNTSQCKAHNPISELLQIALISEEQGDGDALYSEWQVLHCKGKALKDSNSALEIQNIAAKQSLLEQENTGK